jgi:hypothetical protein
MHCRMRRTSYGAPFSNLLRCFVVYIPFFRRALRSDFRPPSPPTVSDTSTDVLDLDPELALIAESIRNQPQSQSQSFTADSFSLGDVTGGPESINVKVKWIPHPEDDAGRPHTWDFVIKRVRSMPVFMSLLQFSSF